MDRTGRTVLFHFSTVLVDIAIPCVTMAPSHRASKHNLKPKGKRHADNHFTR